MFTRDTPEAYRFFTRGLDLDKIRREPWHRRWWIYTRELFVRFSMRLSPARRALYAFAVIFTLVGMLDDHAIDQAGDLPPEVWQYLREHRFPAITTSVCNAHPTSRGQVRLRDPHPASAPIIDPNYLSTAADQQVIVDALRLARRILAQPALAH